MSKATILIVIAALIAGSAGFWASQQLSAATVVQTPVSATPAGVASDTGNSTPTDSTIPTFSLPDLDGQSKTPDDFLGKPLIVNFWATWCAPCRKEMPELMALHRERGDEVQVVGIAMDLESDVQRFIDEMGIRYPILIVGDLAGVELISEFGNPSGMLPYTVFVDADGAIRRSHLGPITLEQVEQALSKL